jgi:hypothetical protein
VTASGAVTITHRDLIVRLAAQHRLPSVYSQRGYAASGGIVSYGPDILEQYRRAADNVDRILLATWLAADEGHEAGALIVTPMPSAALPTITSLPAPSASLGYADSSKKGTWAEPST